MNGLIADKIESALASVVAGVGITGLNIYTGKSSEEKALPCAICSAEVNGDEDPIGSGNYFVNWTVAVKQSAVQNEDGSAPDAESPKALTQDNSSSIIAAIVVDDLAATLSSAVEDLTVFPGSIVFGAAESGRDESGHWIDAITGRCYACGSALS